MKKLCALLLTLLLLLGAAEAEPLFEPTQEGIYNYCPAGFVEDGVTHLYYCTNVDSRVVTDHIGYRSSTDGVPKSGWRLGCALLHGWFRLRGGCVSDKLGRGHGG